MQKTHGKKQREKNKTKRRAIRGGVKLSYRLAGHNQRAFKGLGSNHAAQRAATIEYFKKDNKQSENQDGVRHSTEQNIEDKYNLTQKQQQNLNTRRSRRNNKTSKSTAQEPLLPTL